jgi:RNA polymerase sigma factor (sigma-70 family)
MFPRRADKIGPFTLDLGRRGMGDDQTTEVVQRYLDQLGGLTGDSPTEPVIRALVGRSVDRLYVLCNTMLLRNYPRLARPPVNLETDEMLGSVVNRLLKALREIRPTNARQFFALANRHMRWELNDMARRLDKETPVAELNEAAVACPASSDSQLSPNARRILEAIDNLPDEEREAFDLIRIQNLTQPEAATILGISEATLYRRLKNGLLLLTERLSDLEPSIVPHESD